MYGCQQANIYQSFTIGFRPDHKHRFTGDVLASASLNDYISGSLYWLLSTSSSTGMLGQLYVDYEVELTIPQPSNTYEVRLSESSAFYKEGGIPADSVR